jgi:hypothetical protein
LKLCTEEHSPSLYYVYRECVLSLISLYGVLHSPASPIYDPAMSYQSHYRSPSEESSQEFHASIPPATRKDTIHLTPYSRPPPYNPADYQNGQRPYQGWSGDPRTSSTQSLLPENLPGDGRRTLLLVYIHGFMGNDTSFQKFPAHVHNVLTIALSETHVIHSKIYPRYKSRGAVESTRDDFSCWSVLPDLYPENPR